MKTAYVFFLYEEKLTSLGEEATLAASLGQSGGANYFLKICDQIDFFFF